MATYTYTKLGIANAKSNLNYLTEYTGSGGTSKDGTTLTKNADGTFTVSIALAKSDTATDVPVDEPDRNGFFIPLEKNFSIAETPYLYWNVEAPAGVKYAWTLIYDNVSLDTDTVTDTYHYQMASAFYDRNPTFPRPSDTRFFEGNMINKFDLLSELPDSIFRNGTITLKGITLFVIGPKDAAIKVNGLAFGSDMWSLPTPTPSDNVSAPTASPVAGTYTSAQSVTLSTATAGADIYYTTNGNNPTASSTKYTGAITVDKTMTIKAIAVKSGMTNSDVASFTYTINIAPSKVSAPTANPAAGTYSSTQNVTLSTATAGADIYYTTNGSTPTASSTKYTGAITVDKTTTIKAIAMKSGMTDSDVVSFTYTISAAPSNKVAAPTTNPVSGTSFSSVLSIRLSSATAGAQIYYTLNGSTPKVGESATHLYNGTPITITTTTTIKAIAVKTGMDDSDMTTAVFQYYVPSSGSGGGNYGNRTFASAPVANPGSGTYEKTQSVTLTSATSGATIYYTTNGNTPTTSSMKYTGAITVDKSMTIKAIAVKSGMYNSSTASFTYTIRSGAPIEPNPPTEDEFFKDVSKNDWFYDAVKFVNEKGLFKGVSATEFGPTLNTTRGMLATVLHRLDNTPAAKGPMDFNDVNASDWYADAIAWASEAKVVNGIGNGKFAPNEPITREQLAAMLYRYAQYKGYDVSVGEDTNILSFNDAAAISEYAVPAIQWACGAGIMNGKSGNMLDPMGLATRAEVAAMINRFVANVVEASGK